MKDGKEMIDEDQQYDDCVLKASGDVIHFVKGEGMVCMEHVYKYMQEYTNRIRTESHYVSRSSCSGCENEGYGKPICESCSRNPNRYDYYST